MANVHEAADGIKEMILDWIDANDLDETLEGLHEIPRAVESALHDYATKLREDTIADPQIVDAIDEAAGHMAGIADQIQEVLPFGMQRS